MTIEHIADKASEAIKALILERADKIEQAINDAAEEAQEGGKETVTVTLAHSIKLDLGKNLQTDKLSIATKTTAEITSRFDDPNQPELEME